MRDEAAGGETAYEASGFRVFDRGAHVTHWQPAGAAHPVLFSGSLASIGEAQAWRGGIPVCAPWFAAGPDGRRSPAHGPARTALWRRLTADAAVTRHRLVVDADALGAPAAIELLLSTARDGDSLRSELVARNLGDAPALVEAALHSYFAVSDAREIELSGLSAAPFLDKVTGGREPAGAAIPFGGPVDRVYDSADEPIELRDPGWHRTLRIEREGATHAVVWNPGPDGPADLAEGEWRGFACVEAAVLGDAAWRLAPGEARSLASRVVLLAA